MCLHAEIPLASLLGRAHLGVAQTVLVLRRTRRGNQGGIDHGAHLEQQATLDKQLVDGGQLVFLQPVAKAQDGALIGQAGEFLELGDRCGPRGNTGQ